MKQIFYTIAAAALVLSATGATGQTISTFAGDNTIGGTYAGDGGACTAASLSGPTTCAYDAAGNLYFSDKYNQVIRKITPAGIISTVAGTNIGGYTGDGGAATAAQISSPLGIAFDAAGNLYVAEYGNHVIRQISTSGTISTVAGTGTMSGYAGDGGAATAAKLGYPTDVDFDAAGNMYISDWNNGVVRKVNTSGTISTFAGGGVSYADGIPATDASLYANNGVCTDAAGNVYIADMNDNRIVKITAAGLSYTIGGDGTAGYTGDGGPATAARMSGPAYVMADNAGNVFFSDHNNHVIRKIDASGIITTIAGNHTSGYSGDGGAATAAVLSYPVGLCITQSGDLLICEQGNDIIRKVSATPVALSGTTTICAGNNTTLTSATSSGVWSCSNTSVATVSSTGVVTAVTNGTATISYVLSLGFGSSTINVNPLPVPVVSLTGATLSTTLTYSTYQWLSGATPIPGETNATYNVTSNGSYAVSVTDAGGCSATSAAQVIALGINDPTSGSLKVFPNPVTNGKLAFYLSTSINEAAHVVITNVAGQQVKELKTTTNKLSAIDLDAAPGVYILSVSTEHAIFRTKVIVQ